MVEAGFATAFDLDFMAETGRDIRDYTLKVKSDTKLRKKKYIDTEKLLLDARLEESALAEDIGNSHKFDYLMAVNDHFATGSHPAFRR